MLLWILQSWLNAFQSSLSGVHLNYFRLYAKVCIHIYTHILVYTFKTAFKLLHTIYVKYSKCLMHLILILCPWHICSLTDICTIDHTFIKTSAYFFAAMLWIMESLLIKSTSGTKRLKSYILEFSFPLTTIYRQVARGNY